MSILSILAICLALVTYTGMRMWDTNGNKNEALLAVLVICFGVVGLFICGLIGGVSYLMEALPF